MNVTGSSTGTVPLFCPHCHYVGLGVHYSGCPELNYVPTVSAPTVNVFTEEHIRQIVREEVERYIKERKP